MVDFTQNGLSAERARVLVATDLTWNVGRLENVVVRIFLVIVVGLLIHLRNRFVLGASGLPSIFVVLGRDGLGARQRGTSSAFLAILFLIVHTLTSAASSTSGIAFIIAANTEGV